MEDLLIEILKFLLDTAKRGDNAAHAGATRLQDKLTVKLAEVEKQRGPQEPQPVNQVPGAVEINVAGIWPPTPTKEVEG